MNETEGPRCRVCGSGVRIDPVPGEHATVMVYIANNPLPCCLWCGKVKPRSGWRTHCRGRVRVALREDPKDDEDGAPTKGKRP